MTDFASYFSLVAHAKRQPAIARSKWPRTLPVGFATAAVFAPASHAAGSHELASFEHIDPFPPATAQIAAPLIATTVSAVASVIARFMRLLTTRPDGMFLPEGLARLGRGVAIPSQHTCDS